MTIYETERFYEQDNKKCLIKINNKSWYKVYRALFT